MPRTLTNVRHGVSESNLAKRLAEKGTPHPNEKALMQVHTSQRRLAPHGVTQAMKAGTWIHNYFYEEARRLKRPIYENVRGYVSPYVRAIETAGWLDLPVTWRIDSRLAERNWGDMDQLTYEERVAKYGEDNNREMHGMFWPAANGESLQMLSTRLWEHFDMLARRHSEHDVVEVDHGETELAKRFMLERWLPEEVVHMMLATDTRLSKEVLGLEEPDFQNKIINCRIIQYTREREDGTWDDKYCRVRLIAPSDPKNPKMNLDWKPIVRREYTSAQLREYAGTFKHFLE